MATVEGGERECKINDAAGNWTPVNAYNACMSVRVRSSLPLLFSARLFHHPPFCLQDRWKHKRRSLVIPVRSDREPHLVRVRVLLELLDESEDGISRSSRHCRPHGAKTAGCGSPKQPVRPHQKRIGQNVETGRDRGIGSVTNAQGAVRTTAVNCGLCAVACMCAAAQAWRRSSASKLL